MVNALMLQEALSQSGYAVIHARNGREAVDMALTEHPDIILIDVHMPELNGWEAIKKIRKHAPAPAPFLVLTADVTAETREKIDRANPHCTFNKPVDIDAVLKAVSDLLPPEPDRLSA